MVLEVFNCELFYNYLNDNKGKQFQYGTWDCFIFVEGYYKLRTGKNYFSDIKGRYKTIKGYLGQIKKLGYSSVYELMEANFCSTALSLVKRGDVVIYNDCLGLCDGAYSIFLNQDTNFDHSFVETNTCKSAYIVDRGH